MRVREAGYTTQETSRMLDSVNKGSSKQKVIEFDRY